MFNLFAKTSTKAAALALHARDEGVTGIIGQVLNIPVTCHPDLFPRDKYKYTSFEDNRDAPILNAQRATWFSSKCKLQKLGNTLPCRWFDADALNVDQYVPEVTEDTRHSPILAKSFERLPPALVQVAGISLAVFLIPDENTDCFLSRSGSSARSRPRVCRSSQAGRRPCRVECLPGSSTCFRCTDTAVQDVRVRDGCSELDRCTFDVKEIRID